MRLVEIRLLEGPNVYRLEPTVKVEVGFGRRRGWRGRRMPPHASARLGATVPSPERPDPVAALVAWCRRLRLDGGEGLGGVAVHRSSEPGHWVVTFPWAGAERARLIAEAAVELTSREVSPARRAHLTGAQARRLARWSARIAAARTSPPAWIRDPERPVPIISISGTNGKSTVSRLVTHILTLAGRRVGTTTSDGLYVGERLVDAGDRTGPGGAAMILRRTDIDVAVLETARDGILLGGVGYESDDASVLTNVSSDHLDLQGVHTLPELADVKATICRITRPDGWVVLNADDPLVARVAGRVRARVAMFSLSDASLGERTSAAFRRHLSAGGRGYVLRSGWLVECEGDTIREIVAVREIPLALGGLARFNVANALAAAGGARAMGATIAEVHDGLVDFRPTEDRSPGRLDLYRSDGRLVVVDFAHDTAGLEAILDTVQGLAAGGSGQAAPITAIIGTAGDRPDATLRGMGRIAATRAQRVVIKETLGYLRGRPREHVIEELLAGVAEAGGRPADVRIYGSETAALRGELNGTSEEDTRPEGPRVVLLLCHEERAAVRRLLGELGARSVDVAAELTSLVPWSWDRRPVAE